MISSEKLDKILPALLKAQGEIQHASKSSENPHFKSKYADLATVIDTIKPALQKNGLVVSHSRESCDGEEYLITTIYHAESGQFLRSRTLLQPVKRDPQGYGSAITYARRYDLSALVGLAQDDDDGNAASQPATTRRVYGTADAMKKKYEEIIDAINGASTHDKLKDAWKANATHINAMKSIDEQYYDDLVRRKDGRKKEIADEEANSLPIRGDL